jgi:hypothetical protein
LFGLGSEDEPNSLELLSKDSKEVE